MAFPLNVGVALASGRLAHAPALLQNPRRRGPHPEPILKAQKGHDDPDQKIVAMLDARRLCEPAETSRGKGVTKPKAQTDKNQVILVR